MKLKEPNPLEIFDLRRVEFPVVHFDYVYIEQTYNLEKAIINWIELNMKGRYFVGKAIVLDEENSTKYKLRIGFEKPSELSYFMLACPHLKYK